MIRDAGAFFARLATLWAVALLVLATGALAQDYRIRAGDVLRIEVLEDPNLNRSALVTPDGRVSFPLAGTVPAAGRSVSEVQRNLITRLAVNFATEPTVFVAVERLAEVRATGPAAPATIDVWLVGEAAKPGKIAVEPGTTVLQLFGEMGGFSKFAATKRIQLRRTVKGQESVVQLNYPDIVAGKSAGGSMPLRDGDVLVIPQRRLFE